LIHTRNSILVTPVVRCYANT